MKFNYKETSLLSESDILKTKESLNDYVAYLNEVAEKGGYDAPEASLNLLSDKESLEKVKKLTEEKKSEKLKYIVVVGIGGSSLGTVAIYEAIFGKLSLGKTRYPKMLFLDTNNSRLLEDAKEIIGSEVRNSEELLINVISKSGTTTETISNFEAIYSTCMQKLDGMEKRVVATTDFQSKLWNVAEEKGFDILEIPKNVGGRYSVFSAVGLFPLALAGVDIEKMLDGAKGAAVSCLSGDVEKNPALASAVSTFLHYKDGKNINNSFFFDSELESVGKWYRQLMGESIGKEKDKNGNIANIGITPTVSIGSTDLHSMAQLFLGGPKDKFTTFVRADCKGNAFAKVPEDLVLGELVQGIKGKSFSEIMDAIYEGVKKAYQGDKVPYMEVILDDVSEKSVGEFLQFKMIEMMFLAELLNVNAFDQPNVEDYKKETRKLLEV